MSAIVIFITCPDKKKARAIAGALVKGGLAACVNIIDAVESIFWWEGTIERSKEALLIVKSKKIKLKKIIKRVKALHGYKVPEIIALEICGGYKPYLEWLDESIRKPH